MGKGKSFSGKLLRNHHGAAHGTVAAENAMGTAKKITGTAKNEREKSSAAVIALLSVCRI